MKLVTTKMDAGVLLARTLTVCFVACGLLLVGGEGRKAEAFEAFAKKEKKPCSFCHVNPKGSGKRTPAGEYYKKKKTLKGYVPPKAGPKPGGKPSA